MMRRGGYMLVDKPAGMSSHAAVQLVRRTLGVGGRRGIKAGHAGTLDPFATGLLVVLIGRATRLMPHVVGHDKRYLMTIALGARTSTDDATGDMLSPIPDAPDRPVSEISATEIRAALASIAGRTNQVPPSVSAIHVDGERAYRRVRAGEALTLDARPVRIDDITVLDIGVPQAGLRTVTVDVRCASGTYMRSIARDLGDLLGCGAHAASLRRLEVGSWLVDDAAAPDQVNASNLRSAVDLLGDMPRIHVSAEEIAHIVHGRSISVTANDLPAAGDVAAVADDGSLICLARLSADSVLQPSTVFVDATSMPTSAVS